MCAHVYLCTCVLCIHTCVWGFVCMGAYVDKLTHFPSAELLLALADQEGHSEVRTKERTLIAMSRLFHVSLQTCMWRLTGTTGLFFEPLSKLIHTASWWISWRFNSHRWDKLIFLVFSTKVVGPCVGWLRMSSLHSPSSQQERHKSWDTKSEALLNPEPKPKHLLTPASSTDVSRLPSHCWSQHGCPPVCRSASLGLYANAASLLHLKWRADYSLN